MHSSSLTGVRTRDINILLAVIEQAKCTAINIEKAADNHLVQIDASLVKFEDAPILRAIFSYMLHNENSYLELNGLSLTPSAAKLYQQAGIRYFLINNQTTNPHADLILLSSLLAVLWKNNKPLAINDWCLWLHEYIAHSKPQGSAVFHELNSLKFCMDSLYAYFQDENILKSFIPSLFIRSITLESTDLFVNNNNQLHMDVIRKTAGQHPYLHYAFMQNNESFALLLPFRNKLYLRRYDADANSLFHYPTKNKINLRLALDIFPEDINSYNHFFHLPLYSAVMCNSVKAAHFIMANGGMMSSVIKDEMGNMHTPIFSFQAGFGCYLDYKNNGRTLSHPPKTKTQSGPNCGIYAIDCATQFIYSLHPALFNSKPLHARKRDSKDAMTSLRARRYEAGISGIGHIFSATQLQNLVKINECESICVDITNYSQWLITIKKAIDYNLPIIIPFSADREHPGHPDMTGKARSAHWATIIGWKPAENLYSTGAHCILLANYGDYYSVDAIHLFYASYHMEAYFPGATLYKVNAAKEWKDITHNTVLNENHETAVIPAVELHDFRRKLIVVAPPTFNLSFFSIDRPALIHKALLYFSNTANPEHLVTLCKNICLNFLPNATITSILNMLQNHETGILETLHQLLKLTDTQEDLTSFKFTLLLNIFNTHNNRPDLRCIDECNRADMIIAEFTRTIETLLPALKTYNPRA